MAQMSIEIPDDLGLSEEELKQLREKLQGQLVETLKSTTAEAISQLKAQEKSKVEIAKTKEKEKQITL